ncbi:MAG: hypothetical protein ABI572_12915 [Actinomycetota bacterium]
MRGSGAIDGGVDAGRTRGEAVDGWTRGLWILRVVVLVSVVAGVPHFPSSAAARYVAIAHLPGVPYRDFPVEYPVLELALAELVGAWSVGMAAALLALVAFAGDLLTFVSLRTAWGAVAARRYLWLGTPLLVFIYRRSDLVAVALAVVAVAAARRQRHGPAGASLAGATLLKVWPSVLVPGFFLERRLDVVKPYLIVLVAGTIAWTAFGGPGAVGQVATFRGATGWELESTVGAIVWARTGEHRFEQGANRTGSVPGWARAALIAGLIAGSAAIWVTASKRGLDPWGTPALAAIAWLLALSPLLSPQYVAWLLPWGALAAASGRRWLAIAALPPLLTGGIVASWYLDLHLGPGWNQILLITRNLTVLAIPVAYGVWPRRTVVTPTAA